MIKWEDGELVSPAKVNDDGTITPAEYSGNTPLSAHNLNKAQELTDIYKGTGITASTCEGFGKIHKLYGKTEETGEGEKSVDNPYEISCVGDSGEVKITSTDGTNTSNKVITCKPLCCLKDNEGNIIAQDYIDFTRQKIVRQCRYISSYNSESITTNYVSSTGSLTIGATVVYKLAEAYEEDIDTTNSIVQYADETTIANSDNAEMEVELTKNKAISSINENIGALQEEINENTKNTSETTHYIYTMSCGMVLHFYKCGKIVNCIGEGTVSNLTAKEDNSITINSNLIPIYLVRENKLIDENGTRAYITINDNIVTFRTQTNITGTSYPRFSFMYISQ